MSTGKNDQSCLSSKTTKEVYVKISVFKVVSVQRSKRSKKCVFGDQNDHAYVEISNVFMLRDQNCQRRFLLKNHRDRSKHTRG